MLLHSQKKSGGPTWDKFSTGWEKILTLAIFSFLFRLPLYVCAGCRNLRRPGSRAARKCRQASSSHNQISFGTCQTQSKWQQILRRQCCLRKWGENEEMEGERKWRYRDEMEREGRNGDRERIPHSSFPLFPFISSQFTAFVANAAKNLNIRIMRKNFGFKEEALILVSACVVCSVHWSVVWRVGDRQERWPKSQGRRLWQFPSAAAN